MNINTAPVEEPEGYRAAPGWVKSRPENNDYYVEQFRGDPWFPAIENAHKNLSLIIPGYNIVQIKDKFGGLRFYYDLPDELNTDEYRARADRVISYAEGWVDGYEEAQKEAQE